MKVTGSPVLALRHFLPYAMHHRTGKMFFGTGAVRARLQPCRKTPRKYRASAPGGRPRLDALCRKSHL